MIQNICENSKERGLLVSIDTSFLHSTTGQDMLLKMVLEKISTKIVEEWLSDPQNLQDVLKALNPEAIANLAIAESAAGIREALYKKLPDKIVEVVRRETAVYQKGLFGGMKRIS